MALQHLRSSTANKRPTPAGMSDGQLALNTNDGSPGLFFKDSNGALVKVGPVHVGTTAPNATPGAGGSSGNAIGEQWLDTTGGTYVFKVWDGTAWRSETGTFVDVNGDVMTGALGIIAGSAGSPGLYVSGDTNTGVYSPGADQLAVATGGTGRLFVDASGRIGAGTASPSSRLTVSEISAGEGLELFSSSGNTAAYLGTTNEAGSANGIEIHANRSSGKIVFKVNGTERGRFDSSGRLGIGDSSPSNTFTLKAAAGLTNDSDLPSASALIKDSGSGRRIGLGTSSTGNWIQSSYPGQAGVAYSLLLNPLGGSVGIGTTSPGVPLEVFGGNARVALGAGSPSTLRGYEFASATTVFGSIKAEASGGELRIESGFATFGGFQTFYTNGLERARIDSSGRLLVGTSSSRGGFFNNTSGFDHNFQIEGTLSASFVRNEATGNGAFLTFGKTRGSSAGATTAVVSGDELGSISFQGADGSKLTEAVRIFAAVDGTPGTNDMPGRLVFSTTPDSGSSPVERLRITNGGNVLVHKTSAGLGNDGLELINTGGTCVQVTQSGNGTGAFIANMRYGSGTQYAMYIDFSGTVVGSITCTSTATAFNTSSDYRLKENVVAVTDGIARLQQLKPSRFNFIADPGTTVDGFIAHEVQNVVPEAITGEKDAVDTDGNPKYQGIDQSKLVPLLTAALQEAVAKIESLEARLTAAGI